VGRQEGEQVGDPDGEQFADAVGVPRVKSEKDACAPVAVWYIASAAAIFIGWAAVIARLRESPKNVVSAPEMTIIHMPNLRAGRMVSACCLR
jgi:hypothetical protein